METGYRIGTNGAPIPRDIITAFTCRYGDEEIFRAELSPAIAANPFISFFTIARDSSTLSFHWEGDDGFSMTETADISVE
jgi:sulfur-oxidizing protein SoxZ